MKFEERKLAVIGLGATLEKMKDFTAAAALYKNEGFASKLQELEKKMRKSSGHEEMLKALQEPEESVGYESEVEKALKTN